MKIYLPNELTENQCAFVYDKDTIRVFEEIPTENSTIDFTDYYINSNYLSKKGKYTFSTELPSCLNNTDFTTDYYYRNDFDRILIIFFIILFIVYYIFSKIIHSFFLGFRR